MTPLEAVPTHGDVVAVVVDGETVLYRAADTSLHKLDAVATAVWQLLDGQETLRTTVEDLAAAYRAPVEQVERDVVALVDMLVTQGLVELRLVG